MHSIKRILLIVITLLLIVACCPAPVRPDTIIQYQLIKPTPEMLVPCPVTPPPDQNTYLASSIADKEKLLFNLSSDLYSNLTTCNNHWAALNKWYVEQAKLYDAPIK